MKSGNKGHSRIKSLQSRHNRLAMAGTAVAILAASGLLPLQNAAFAADDTGYELLEGLGGSNSYAYGVNADGTVVVGNSNVTGNPYTRAFRWTAADGMDNLGTISGNNSYARGVNADGSVVVGYASANFNTRTHAFRWTAGVMRDLGTLGGGDSYASGVNDDGTVVVGVSLTTNDAAGRAFRWVQGTGANPDLMSDLGTLGGRDSSASGVNADGTIVVGDSDISGGGAKHAFRWVQGTGGALDNMADLGTLGGTNSYARGVNADGSVIIGESQTTGDTATHAFRWAQGTGGAADSMISLGTLGGINSYARGVSADGSVVVGESQITNSTDTRGFRWTADTDMLSIEDWLRANGETVASDFTKTANAVSGDGNVIVGETTSGSIYIARLSSGIIDVDQYMQTLAAKPSATQIGLSYAGTTLNGAHGEPMRNLLDAGRQSLQITTDAGYDNGKLSDGGVAISDLTYGVGLEGGITARLAAGGLYTRQDIDAGGDFTQKAFHVAPEVTLPVVDSVYATIGSYYSSGKLDINRGYLNGGALDYSHGDTDTQTWGGKVRFDWLNAFSLNDVKLTPYTSLTYSHAHMDAYTENGGGFPSSFDSMSDHSTVARVGLDGVTDITEQFRLLGKLEADYRFEKQTAGASGTIIGLSGFNLAGQDIDQFWVRAGIGAEFDTKVGTAFVSLNATTQGDDPTVWVKSGWKVTF